MIDANAPDLTIGVIGAGTMGRGIAQVGASAGCRVRLFDVREQAVKDALGFIGQMFDRNAEKGRMTAEEASAAKGRLTPATALSELADCDLVIEVVIEDIDAKKALFAELEQIVRADAILATNTSSLSVTEIASATKTPSRVAGFHFFNPPPLMKLVEVVRGLNTDPSVVDALVKMGTRMSKQPVVCEDTPGFLVNHAGRAYGPEALFIVSQGICEPADVDRVMKDQAGFRMGPFELLDLVGLDIAHGVMEAIYDQYYQEPMYKPSVLGRLRVAGGLLGRKTNRGFYTYDGGQIVAVPEPSAPPRGDRPVWVSPAVPEGRAVLTPLLEKLGAKVETGDKPSKTAICFVTPLGGDVSSAAVAQGLDPARTVGVDTLFDQSKRRTLMLNPLTDPAVRDAAHGLLAAGGGAVTVIADSPGFIAQRIVAMIVNVACNIAQQKVAAPADIDTAVKLGLNYPKGPLEWGDEIGAQRVLAILEAMHAIYQEPRYRPSPWLKRRAALGVSLTTPEPSLR